MERGSRLRLPPTAGHVLPGRRSAHAAPAVGALGTRLPAARDPPVEGQAAGGGSVVPGRGLEALAGRRQHSRSRTLRRRDPARRERALDDPGDHPGPRAVEPGPARGGDGRLRASPRTCRASWSSATTGRGSKGSRAGAGSRRARDRCRRRRVRVRAHGAGGGTRPSAGNARSRVGLAPVAPRTSEGWGGAQRSVPARHRRRHDRRHGGRQRRRGARAAAVDRVRRHGLRRGLRRRARPPGAPAPRPAPASRHPLHPVGRRRPCPPSPLRRGAVRLPAAGRRAHQRRRRQRSRGAARSADQTRAPPPAPCETSAPGLATANTS